jgi:hypothetical protein
MTTPDLPLDPRDMRKRIMRAAYRGERLDGKHGLTVSIAHAVLRTAEHAGYSGEDTMTMLAYHAILQLEQMQDLLTEQVSLTPSPPMVFIK